MPLAEAVERLQSPYVLEEFSALGGHPILVVDCRSPTSLAAASLARADVRLTELACPSIAIVDAGPPPPLRDGFDAVVSSERELAPILDVVARAPLAAMTLVQLLRHNAGLTNHEGLLAESLAYSTLQRGPEFSAWLAGELLGTAAWRINADDGTQARVGFVFARHSGFGIGSRLLAEAEARALAWGFDRLTSFTTLNGVPFFQKRGYTVVSRGVKVFSAECALPVAFLAKRLARRPAGAPARAH